MEQYRNVGGDSGVRAFKIDTDSIIVQFKDGAKYEYTATSAGVENIKQMHSLARRGQGLNSFIMRNVKTRFSRKM